MGFLRKLSFIAANLLVFSFVVPVFSPTSASAYNYVSESISADGVGRAGGITKVSVYSKIPNGVTVVNDQVSVGLFGMRNGQYSYNFTSPNESSSFATTFSPTNIVSGFAVYDFSIPSRAVTGSYLLKYCVSTNSSPYTYSDLNGLVGTYDNNQNFSNEVGCKTKVISVGAAPSILFCANRSVSASSLIESSRYMARNQISIFDSNGRQTLLSGTEEIAVQAVSSNLSGSPRISEIKGLNDDLNNVEKLIFDSSSGDSDGGFRLVVSDVPNVVSKWLVFLTSQSANRTFAAGNISCAFDFSTAPIVSTGYKVQTMFDSANPRYASGTDGQLYFWGSQNSSLQSLNVNKPTKLEFMPLLGYKNGTTVRKLVSQSHVISSDGRIYTNQFNQYKFGLSVLQAIQGGLQSLSFPALHGVEIVDASTSMQYLLDSEGRVWERSVTNFAETVNYLLVDLSSIGTPVIAQIVEAGSDTLVMRSSSGLVYSVGGNEFGKLGQASNLASGVLGQVYFPNSETITSIMSGGSFLVALGSQNNVWAWGSNAEGRIAKDPSVISSANAPILTILPSGISPKLWRLNSGRMSFLSSDNQSIYATNSLGGWTSVPVADYFASLLNNELIEDYGGYIYSYGFWSAPVVVTSTNRVIQGGNSSTAIGNCTSSRGAIRSIGQFGPVSTDDAIKYVGIFQSDLSSTKSVSTSISAVAGVPFTLQVAQLRTNCYDIGELEFRWDLSGNGTYGSPVTPTLGQTGYQTLSADLTYSTPGRKTISLKLRTPDEADYFLNFIVGVDPAITPTVPFSDTSSALVFSGGSSTLAVGRDGNLYVWGNNNNGQLAFPTSIYSSMRLPLKLNLPDNKKVLSAFVTNNAIFVVDQDGKAWASGYRWQINGAYSNYETMTAISYLSDKTLRDIQIGPIGFALQSSGQLLSWPLSGSLAFVPSQVVALSGISIKQFAIQSDESSIYRLLAIDVDGNLWRVPFTTSGAFSDAVKETGLTDVRTLSWNGTQATIVTGNGSVWYSVNASTSFGQVTGPAAVTPVDAMYSNLANVLFLKDSTNQIWTASASQSGSTVIMSTWTKYAAQVNGQANSSDIPNFQHRGARYIYFNSGNLLYLGPSWTDVAGRCQIYTSSDYGNRVFSTGQFGAANITDNLTVNPYIAIASQNQTTFSNGQFFAVDAGDSVVIRMLNPRSNCFSSSLQFSAKADLDGSGNFATDVPLSNEGSGNFAFTFSAVAPNSGIKNISIRITPPLGSPSIYSVGLGVYSNSIIPEIVPRTRPVNTAESAVFAIGSDGYAYGWATPTDIASDYYGSTISFMNLITNAPPRNPGTPTKLVLPGNPKIREAVPFVSCCTPINYRYIFGALVVDENGKTYTWATDSALEAANGYAYRSSPTTPTEIPALKGVDVVRVSVSSNGSRALALASNGAVYEWHINDGSGTTYTQPTRVGALAGLKIVDIYASSTSSMALTADGDVYTFYGQRGYLGRSIPGSSYSWSFSATAGKVNIGESVKAILPIADNQISAVITNSNKIYVWGYFYNRTSGSNVTLLEPTLVTVPGNRTPVAAGTVHYENLSSNAIAASDGTWWSLSGNAQNQVTLYQRSTTPSAIGTGLRTFASGNGQAISLNDGSIWTTNRAIAGTCGLTSTFTRVMSAGQLGPEHKADQVYINVSGNEITRPNAPTSVSLTGWSACDGGSNINFSVDADGTGTYGSPFAGSNSLDGSRATATYTFTKTQNGPVYMGFKASTSAGLSGTTSFYTKVVPAPLPGRQIGISVNNGDRYTNSSNVTLNLVWPDGTTKIFVSNDGGFAPGTVSSYDLQYTIPWVLPPQAVIPLPSIVYARFDNDPTTYYFDDIILDSVAPTLTFIQSK